MSTCADIVDTHIHVCKYSMWSVRVYFNSMVEAMPCTIIYLQTITSEKESNDSFP